MVGWRRRGALLLLVLSLLLVLGLLAVSPPRGIEVAATTDEGVAAASDNDPALADGVPAAVGTASSPLETGPSTAPAPGPARTQGGEPQSRQESLRQVGNSPPARASIQTDLAFWGHYAFAGSYSGFRMVDVSNPRAPVPVGEVACNGGQGDVSVWQGLLFVSVDRPQTAPDCSSRDAVSPGVDAPIVSAWEGIRIFDVRNPGATGPQSLLAAVPTRCGSHTHTLVPDGRDPDLVHIYVSSTAEGAVSRTAQCGSPHGRISIVHVPLANPAGATVTEHFLSRDTLPTRGNDIACHDITVFLELNVAAASCQTEGQLWDISDRGNPDLAHPVHLRNPAVEYWHSASFSWDGRFVAFGDEAGGGVEPRCRSIDPATVGAIWIYAVSRDPAQVSAPLGSFKIPRPQDGAEENCTAHNFAFLPTAGRAVIASAWYLGGTSVVDVTDPARPVELAAFDPPAENPPAFGGHWSSYAYNGFVYADDIHKGLEIFDLPAAAALAFRPLPWFNPQTQESLIR